MGVRDVLPILAERGAESRPTHAECRECGTNLSADTDACPSCGGGVVVYEL